MIRLLDPRRRKKGIFGLIFSRTGIVLITLALAALCIIIAITQFGEHLNKLLGGVVLINIAVIITLLSTDMDSSAKTTWCLIISATSIFGALFYLYTRLDPGNRIVRKEYRKQILQHRNDLPQDPEVFSKLEEEAPEAARLAQYLASHDAFPVTTHNSVTYYPLGENKWADMLEELRKAEKFIFMEYFIVEEGNMWGSILSILKEKATNGVDVRIMYDGTCVLGTLPYMYPEMIRKLGIRCKMFSPLRPFASTHYNYRDHRKILVIDGKVGFTGGVNLADEYINQKERFGHWKDTAIRIKGEAVRTLTHMFLNMWDYGMDADDHSPYLNVSIQSDPEAAGYVIPYGFNPFDSERIGERVYMDILYNAKKYVHIMTPYLILDDELRDALKYAAGRGVDVCMILPGIPDKKAVYMLAKTYFRTLIEAGVRIYLYTPGFVHAKVFVSDDVKAVVGTINLDYRSLYHHFECGAFLYGTSCISDIEQDFLKTREKCQIVTEEMLDDRSIREKILGNALRMVAPLL